MAGCLNIVENEQVEDKEGAFRRAIGKGIGALESVQGVEQVDALGLSAITCSISSVAAFVTNFEFVEKIEKFGLTYQVFHKFTKNSCH
jgi:hypothetical protein